MTATLLPGMKSFTEYADDVMKLRYSHTVSGRKESWEEICWRVVSNIMSNYCTRDEAMTLLEYMQQRKFIPGGRILAQAGRPYHQTDNCFCMRAENTREGWAKLLHDCTLMFMSGGGVGVDYSDISPYGTPLKRSGGIASGPIPLIKAIDSIAEASRQGGERRGACYASLPWWHDAITDFIGLKTQGNALNHTNISVRFDEEDIAGYSHQSNRVFLSTLKHACQYGDPGFQFDYDDQTLRNACTEIISHDNGDSCCIGSINLAAISSLAELADVTHLAVLFLLCNTLYTDKPTAEVAAVKERNRRLGLGLMGVAEWFMQRGLLYGHIHDTPQEPYNFGSHFKSWLGTYQHTADTAAKNWSNRLNIATPVATRAIAPTGTISILGHTTPGIEPVFHTAYQRTYNTLKTQEYANGYRRNVVIDPIVSKWLEQGYSVDDIDTAYTLAQTSAGIERRIAFQAYCQTFVDNAISSTVNLPRYVEGSESRLAPLLLKYLPQLRGITCYPDGARDNQPVVPIDIQDALDMQPTMLQSDCKGGSCGI